MKTIKLKSIYSTKGRSKNEVELINQNIASVMYNIDKMYGVLLSEIRKKK